MMMMMGERLSIQYDVMVIRLNFLQHFIPSQIYASMRVCVCISHNHLRIIFSFHHSRSLARPAIIITRGVRLHFAAFVNALLCHHPRAYSLARP
jgi:hypothetical protein